MSLSRLTEDGEPRQPDFIDQLLADNEAERERQLLDRTHSYMRNAHLLPPRDEYGSVDEYIRLLKRFERVPATQVSFYRFLPTPAQRRANADVLARWEAAQRKPKPGDGDRRKRALALLNWRIYTGSNALAKAPEGVRDGETNKALRYLAPLVNEGLLTRDELSRGIIDASHTNKHIPGNKSVRQVEYDIDRAISKFAEPFGWDRLDDDVR